MSDRARVHLVFFACRVWALLWLVFTFDRQRYSDDCTYLEWRRSLIFGILDHERAGRRERRKAERH